MKTLQFGKVAGSAAVIVDHKILLLQRSSQSMLFPEYWTFPSGGVEPNDAQIEATVIREVAEETGLQFVPRQKFGFYESHIEGKRFFALVFLGDISGQLSLQAVEVQRAEYFTFAEAVRLPLAFAYHEVLQDLYAQGLIR